jgi:hypothetical protein
MFNLLVLPAACGKTTAARFAEVATNMAASRLKAILGDTFSPVFSGGTPQGIVQHLKECKRTALAVNDEFLSGFGHALTDECNSDERALILSLLSPGCGSKVVLATKTPATLDNATVSGVGCIQV